ncbi:hypothetical protein MHBO_004332 [Bonamia ostreae]|uniref:Uncharacterized protein n=1 Tax=Bonamia ostreae TaxID=126728 RepID=A0ABV2AT93_9EUKA
MFPTAAVDVPEHIATQARHILNPPPAPTKPVSEALRSPPRVRVLIRGKIVQVRFLEVMLIKLYYTQ